MSKKHGFSKIHIDASDSVVEWTSNSISKTPMEGKAGDFKDYRGTHGICGNCGNGNTKLIQCLDCGFFTRYYFSDRM